MLLVTFEIQQALSVASSGELTPPEVPAQRVAQLEAELMHARENLQGTIEEFETSNEELKSMNEELQSTNEELQSANEELETSREEMQSMNEELQTLNAELQDRNEELSQINDDMQNLLNSTDVATLFLDRELRIKRFTAPAGKVFHLRDSDIGRPLQDMAASLLYGRLLEDASQVLRTLVFTEQEVEIANGGWRLMRILPYRTAHDVIDGLVITFLDIEQLKQVEQRAHRARCVNEAIFAALTEALVVCDGTRNVLSANAAFYRTFGGSDKSTLGEPLSALGVDLNHPELTRRLDALDRGEAFEPLRLNARLRDNSHKDLLFRAFDLKQGTMDACFVLLIEELTSRQLPQPIELQ
jgi:two-component system CheB/CheR fusion protein